MIISSEILPTQRVAQGAHPLKKKWFGQASLSGLKKIENVEALAKKRLPEPFHRVRISFQKESRDSQKFQNDPSDYREIIESLHRHGIAICGAFIFGFDEDDPSIFEETSLSPSNQTLLSGLYDSHPLSGD